MSSLNLYDTAILPITRVLHNLSKILKKAETFANSRGIPHSEFLEARIAPDMKDLAFQIHTVSNTAKFLASRVGGVQTEPWDDNEKTFDELQGRITKTLQFLETVKREDFEGKEDNEVIMRGTKFSALSYVNEFALPNFFFHAVTTYDILRMKGVDIGKADWLGWR